MFKDSTCFYEGNRNFYLSLFPSIDTESYYIITDYTEESGKVLP